MMGTQAVELEQPLITESRQLEPAIMSPPKLKSYASTEGLDYQNRNKATFNTAGKVQANRPRV